MPAIVPNKHIRLTILNIIHNSGAAHIGSALSLVEVLNAVFKSVDLDKIKHRDYARDRIILSKGHGTAALYAVMYHCGLLTKEEINSYSQNGSLLQGHTSHFAPYVEHSTGSLGHGLPVALGVALGFRSKGISSKAFVVVGDGELHEGSNWEAIMLAGHLKVGNLCLLVDKNKMSQIGELDKCCSIDPLAAKFESFHWKAIEILDGHNEEVIFQAIQHTKNSTVPVAIICDTIKGKGISFMENNNLWHYRAPQGEDYEKALSELK